uniref:C-type lectin domain-containing protein n=1 Tax=Sinocyclocheilus anshuiensis TaxID=1608454 RepID=A0A671KKV4_9TELE
IMKTVFTFEGPSTRTQENSTTCPCGSWVADPFNDYCYLFITLSMRKWADARADCVFQIHLFSLWMGAHDSITEGGWMWTDGSPFRYINWASGNPDDYYNEDCLSILINSGAWNDDNCENKRGYICKRRGTFCCPFHSLRNNID